MLMTLSLVIDLLGVGVLFLCFFFQAEDGIRDLVRSRGLGDVYKRQHQRDLDGTLVAQQFQALQLADAVLGGNRAVKRVDLSLIHI